MSVPRYRPENLPGDDDYDVGFGKPPTHTQFKPGESGNPSGRPPGTRSIADAVKAALREPVTVTHNGKVKKVTAQDALLLRIFGHAMNGKAAFAKIMTDLWMLSSRDEPAPALTVLSADEKAEFEVLFKRIQSGAVSIGDHDSDNTESPAASHNSEEDRDQ
ncbi:MAG: DUF5681 domain-containing protein [Rhizobiaceae bacterium]